MDSRMFTPTVRARIMASRMRRPDLVYILEKGIPCKYTIRSNSLHLSLTISLARITALQKSGGTGEWTANK